MAAEVRVVGLGTGRPGGLCGESVHVTLLAPVCDLPSSD